MYKYSPVSNLDHIEHKNSSNFPNLNFLSNQGFVPRIPLPYKA